ncbi:MAG TPA: CDP-alcohol phosphatidyltransferase family protein, partial [Woeseiaceae bacterium]|nr:CDP-alcohol phosphatidyltransferase family protein [Woeseiaceae bacterium]
MSLRWLPNAISLMRIGLVAPVVWMMLESHFEEAIVLFFIAGFSDGLDGYLAKRFDWHTRLGGILDPVADKLLVASAFITLVSTGHVPLWLAVAVVLRDVIIVGGATAYNFLVGPIEGEPTR